MTICCCCFSFGKSAPSHPIAAIHVVSFGIARVICHLIFEYINSASNNIHYYCCFCTFMRPAKDVSTLSPCAPNTAAGRALNKFSPETIGIKFELSLMFDTELKGNYRVLETLSICICEYLRIVVFNND